jgi:hypothetical protein
MTTVHHVDGFGTCIATAPFQQGDTVLELSGPIVAQPTRESIELDLHAHIIDPQGSFVNHAATPTTRVNRLNQCLEAVCAIAVDDEITFDYNQNETCMAAPFRARDGSWVAGVTFSHER